MSLDASSFIRLPQENAKEAKHLLALLRVRLREIRESSEKIHIRVIQKKILGQD